MTNMYTKQDDLLVKTEPQPDLVVAMTVEEIKRELEGVKNSRALQVEELGRIDQKITSLEEMLVKCAELGIKEVEVLEPVTPDAGNA